MRLLLSLPEQFSGRLCDDRFVFLFYRRLRLYELSGDPENSAFDRRLFTDVKRLSESDRYFYGDSRHPLAQSRFHDRFVKKRRNQSSMRNIFITLMNFLWREFGIDALGMSDERETKTRRIFFPADETVCIVFQFDGLLQRITYSSFRGNLCCSSSP